MKQLFYLLILLSVFTFSCEKSEQDNYTLKFFGDALEDIGYSVAIASDGYIITGQYNKIIRENGTINTGLSNKEMVVIKTGWSGNLKWKVVAGGKYDDWGRKVYKLDDGSMICTGTMTDTIDPELNGTDVYLVRISEDGKKMWEKAWGGPDNQTGIDIIKTEDGFIVLGTTDSERAQGPGGEAGNNRGKLDFLFLKVDENGGYIAHNQYGFWEDELPSAIKYEIGGNFVVLGTTKEKYLSNDLTDQKNNIILFRLKSNLANLEPLFFGGITDDYSSDLEVRRSGYLVAGNIGKEGDVQQAFVAYVKKDFEDSPVDPFVPIKIQGASTTVKSMYPYFNGHYLLAGYSGSGSGADMLVFETDSMGIPLGSHVMINGSTGGQVANDVVSGDDGYIIAVGKNSYEYNSLISFLKFRF